MTRRSNRKDRLRLPYHINLPKEIRLIIYDQLFNGMIAPSKPYPYWPQKPSLPHRCKELELRMLSILRVSKPTREEALPIFEQNIIVSLQHEDQFMWIQRSCRQAKTLRLKWIPNIPVIGEGVYERNLSAKLPALERLECDVEWKYPITCSNVETLVNNLNGSRLAEHVTILEAEVKQCAIKLKDFTCDFVVCMTFELLYEWDGFNGPKVSYFTMLRYDVRKQQVVERSIRVGKDWESWVPAHEVVILRQDLVYPALYHRPSGRMYLMSEKERAEKLLPDAVPCHTRSESRNPSSAAISLVEARQGDEVEEYGSDDSGPDFPWD